MFSAISDLIQYQPTWLYQLKPLLLVIVGLFAYPVAPISASIFAVAAVMIFGMRRRWW